MALQVDTVYREVVVRTRHTSVVILVLVLAMALLLFGCGKKVDSSTNLNLGKDAGSVSGSGSSANGTGGEGASGAGTSGTKATDQAGGESSGASAGQTGSGSTSGQTGGSKSAAGGTSASAKGITIKIMWWNDTQDRAPKNPEIVFGGKSYKPASGKSDQGAIGPCPVGKPLTLTIYPDGRTGAKLVAKFQVDAQMIANSEQDAIHVEIKDTGVRVLGNPVNNFIQSFSRP